MISDGTNSVITTLQASSAFSDWKPFEYRSEITSIIVITIIMTLVLVYYNFSMKKLDPNKPPKGIAFFIFNLLGAFKTLVYEIMGKEFIKFTPYIFTVFCYIFLCNIISVVGFENPTALTTVTFALGLFTTLGTIILGIKYQKSSFFYKFLFKFYIKTKSGNKVMIPYFFNPFGITDIIMPWISISLRLWANIMAGALILGLFYALPMVMFRRDPTVLEPGPEVILFSLFAVPFHGFLDWLVGSIQAFVFVVLTLCYWSGSTEPEEESQVKKIKKKSPLSELKMSAEKRNQSNVDLINVSTIE
ncbi:F0F1 ATP synthase subunit A [Malacoplasma penetrans]|uniref:ATP synthase subunit A n=1 Tax=Malacoplasma penetrans (strain HF-2) TaxID=272633 RepID=Q8EWZ4_MALP2|nr:F0F1 ATP synthase subunit A [Malacoplasma penetrans]RXY97363.1 F0F1 ATP synthase subunit A [Malacoplasma penetrans]BAC43846.1 ATP synthase subunit A [Malacoplasma penetrans HF-2]